eukprot:s1158_g9.t1
MPYLAQLLTPSATPTVSVWLAPAKKKASSPQSSSCIHFPVFAENLLYEPIRYLTEGQAVARIHGNALDMARRPTPPTVFRWGLKFVGVVG